MKWFERKNSNSVSLSDENDPVRPYPANQYSSSAFAKILSCLASSDFATKLSADEPGEAPKQEFWSEDGSSKQDRDHGQGRRASSNYHFLYTLLVLLVVFSIPAVLVQGAPVTLTQSDWDTRIPGSVATEPFGAWGNFSYVDNGVQTGPDIQLVEDNHNMVQGSDDGSTDTCSASGCGISGGFNAGTRVNTVVIRTGPAAKIKLDTTIATKAVGTNLEVPLYINLTEDPNNNLQPEQINAIAISPGYIYVAGFESPAANDEEWRIEKRNSSSGQLLTTGTFGGGTGIVRSDQNAFREKINALLIDAGFIYAAGYSSGTSSTDEQWQIEKRDILNGNLDAAFDGELTGNGTIINNANTATGPEQITAIVVDDTYIYVAGYDNDPGNTQWRIEKRDKNNGMLDSGFGTSGVWRINPSSGADEILAMVLDGNDIYVAGFDSFEGDTQWRIEKISKVDGTSDGTFGSSGVVLNNPNVDEPDQIHAIAVDGTYLYVAGFDSNGQNSSEQWRVEKRLKSTGALDTAFDDGTVDGVIVSDPSSSSDPEKITSIAIDNNYIFVAGYDALLSPSMRWRIECRNIVTGALMNEFNNDGSVEFYYGGPSAAKINAIALDERYLYAAGFDGSGGSGEQWRIKKLSPLQYLTNGTFESSVIDLGGIVNNFNNFVWGPPAQPDPANVTLTLHARAGTNNTPDCNPGPCTNWTNWELLTLGSDDGGALSGKQHFQYRATLATSNLSVSPEMIFFLLQFSNYSTGAGLESSVFDTGNANNFLTNITWDETLAGAEDVRLQVATSGDGGANWTYCGLDAAACSTTGWLDWGDASPNNYYTDYTGVSELLHLELSDADSDRYFKYKVWLSGNGTSSPIVDTVNVTYDTAHLAVTAPSGSVQTAGTAFDIVITVRDSSGVTYNGHDHLVTLRLVASVPQPDVGACVSSFNQSNNTELSVGGTFSSGVITIDSPGIILCQSTETSFTISVFETSGGALTSNSDLTISRVSFDSATKQLVFTTQPARNGIAGDDLNPLPIVSIQDQYGNVDLLGTDSILLSVFQEGSCGIPATGVLSVDTNPVTASAGIATFSGINYDTSEQTIYLKAEVDPAGTPNVCSDSILIADSGYVVQIDTVYDLTTDAIVISTSFLQSGSIVNEAAVLLNEIDIQDSSLNSIAGGPFALGNGTDVSTVTDSVNRIFHTTWDPSGGFITDATYTILSRIEYNGTIYSNDEPFKIGQLGVIKSGLTQLDTSLNGVQTTVADIDTSAVLADTAVASLDTKVTAHAAAQAAYRAQLTTKLLDIQTKVGSILADTSKTIPDSIKITIAAELAKGGFTEIVTTQAAVKTGATIPFRYRTASGLSPTVTVLDPKEAGKIISAPMKEVSGTGIYVYNITFKTDWGLGNFMIRVDETTKSSVDHIILKVVQDTKESKKAKAASSAVTLDTLYSRMNSIDNNVNTLASGMNIVKSNTENVSSDINALLDEVDDTSSGVAATGNLEKFSKYINSVSSIIGSSGSTIDIGTILGKLNGIETTLDEMGSDASAAMNFNESAKEKAERIKRFVTLIMTEIREEGSVEDAEEKAEILDDYLTDLKDTVEEIPSSVTTGFIAESVKETLEELDNVTVDKEGLEGIIVLVEEEYEAVGDIQVVEDLSPVDLQKMRNDVSGLKSLMVEIRGLLDSEVNQPVVHGWLEGE